MSFFAKIVDNTGIELVCNQNLTISNLCLEDAEGANSEFTILFLKVGEEDHVFCQFNEDNLQMYLKMKFRKGFKLSFFTRGPGKVHVLGYYEQSTDVDEDEEIADVFVEHDEERRKSHMG